MGKYHEVRSEDTLKLCLKLCKGSYQEGIVLGIEALSGATLKGKALKYKRFYQTSSKNLLKRLKGLAHEERRDHGKRVLVIG